MRHKVTALTLTAGLLSACTMAGGHAYRPMVYQSAPEPAPSGESYEHLAENTMVSVADSPLSTFSIDVDTASYSNVRRFLNEERLPPVAAVRVEELINYFNYDYQGPADDTPFSVTTQVTEAPWAPERQLVHIGVQGRRLPADALPPRNLVFLLDVSGSMSTSDKLPLLLRGLQMLVDQLNERDHVSIVVYAGADAVVLPPTAGDDKEAILGSLQRLSAGGSTNGSAGIKTAYELAEKNFQKGAINRVILATDGDFNVGIRSNKGLVRLIEEKRKTGVFLTVLGFGTGNIKDDTMEKLADKGNGNYAYIDSLAEARKVLVTEMGSTLATIAKDVKIQVAFNPELVASYRLIGYENRKLEDRDFDDDSKDAGEIGAGHSVTALYEVVPTQGAERDPSTTGQLMTVKMRYKQPDGDASRLLSFAVDNRQVRLSDSSHDVRFAAAVAGFGMLLRGSQYRGSLTYGAVADLAGSALGRDRHGYRAEFLKLVGAAAELSGSVPANQANVAR